MNQPAHFCPRSCTNSACPGPNATTRYLKTLQVCLRECWRGVDRDLTEDTASGINKAMRRISRNNHDPASVNFACLIADGDHACAFECEYYFNVRMCV